MHDIAIIGAGPAGLTAALYAGRANRSVLVFEKAGFGGQVTHSPKIENYPGDIEMSGIEFADRLIEQVLAQGADTEFCEVLGIESGECTEDLKFSVEACRCIGACGLAPVFTINEDVYGRVTPDEIPEILAKYQ